MDVEPAMSATSTETIRRSPELRVMWKFYVHRRLRANALLGRPSRQQGEGMSGAIEEPRRKLHGFSETADA
jgi:hypothetical protein